jgi:manganese/iron transport system substrate-binding protein
MKTRLKMTLGCLVAVWLTACSATTPLGNNPKDRASGKIRVVSTSTMIADWAQQVGGSEIDHTSILKPGIDPHVYEPVPADTRAFEQANLILYNGYNLEPGLIRLMESAGSKAQKVPVGEGVQPLAMSKDGKGTVPDPHVWGDAKNAIVMVKRIRDELIRLAPEDKIQFTQNATKLIEELQALDRWMAQQLQTIPPNQRQLVTTHDAFQYYARAYGLKVVGTLIGISTEEQPSAQTVKRLVESIKATGTPMIFAETTINPTLIQTVAQSAGVKLAPKPLYSDSVGAPGSGAESYVKMMLANTQVITQALGGTVKPFEPIRTTVSPPISRLSMAAAANFSGQDLVRN